MNANRSVTYARPRMGTLLAVTCENGRSARGELSARTAFAIAARLERVMSRHDATTALSQLNRAAGRPVGVTSLDLARIVRQARTLAQRTEGAFDPTVGPLIELWRWAGHRGRAPSRWLLDIVRARVGWQAIDVEDARVSLARPGMSLDLGGFGKGVTLDRIAAALARRRAVPALLNFGESSLRALGRPPMGGWPVLLRHPLGGFAGEFRLREGACSTSAALSQRTTVSGQTVGHIIDPRTGRAVAARAQVTVLARSAALAEAVSTALIVLGRPAMRRIAERLSVDACWVDRSGIHMTAGFRLRMVV